MALRSAPQRPSSSAPVLDTSVLPGSAHAVGGSGGAASVVGAVSGARPARRARGRPAEETAVAARRRADALLGGTSPGDALPGDALLSDELLADALLADGEAGDAREGARTRSDAARGRVEDGPSPGRTGAPRQGAAALRERLPLWFQLRCGLEPRTAAALGVVLAGLAVLAGAHFWSAGPESVRVPEAVGAAAEESAVPRAENVGAQSLPSPPSRPAPAQVPEALAADRIVVDVNGKVRRPGVQHLKAGARVADALHAAGGVLAGTDITGLNRARVLVDGEQVVVGFPTAPQPPGPGGVPGPGGEGAAQAGGPLSLNTATAEQLETLPGVGPVLAQHIVDYRVERGGYASVDELREVTGIGDRRFADLQPLVRP